MGSKYRRAIREAKIPKPTPPVGMNLAELMLNSMRHPVSRAPDGTEIRVITESTCLDLMGRMWNAAIEWSAQNAKLTCDVDEERDVITDIRVDVQSILAGKTK